MSLLMTLLVALFLIPLRVAAEMPTAGAPFPSWSLPDHQGKVVSSAELAGSSYVLWFYPKAMTPGCTIEGNAFRDRSSAFADQKVQVFGISFDSPSENARFVANQGFPFRLLSDEKRTLGKAVGAATSDREFARRISFLVGADGAVIKTYTDVDPADHAAEVLRDIAAASSGSQRAAPSE